MSKIQGFLSKKEIRRRLLVIDNRIQEIAKQVPTYEEFLQKWETMDDISRSLYVFYAECPEMFGEVDRYHKTIFEYLRRMGFVKNQYSLTDIINELEEQ